MSRIKVMSTALSNRIAAGEVIERPASVVKELVENSIDAGSSFINVEVERAGSKLIAVSDDGCGMDSEDIRLCLEQHGTSKLLSEEDLDHIMTLGFRGEALPSIASVSRFSAASRTADSPEGTMITCDGGENTVITPCGGAVGTRIEVRDLFFNLPARKKFLKSAATEEHHIEEVMILLAIAHPEVGFKLRIDNRIAFNTPAAGNQEYRLRELFGKSFVEKMLFFNHIEGSLHISGCVASPGFTRPSRRDQRVFINSRPVESQAVYRGIKEGYATLCEPGRYSPAIIFIEMPPEELDVNVHPAKREVRFKSEFLVSRAVTAAVSAALRKMRTRDTDADKNELPLNGKLPLSLLLDAAEVRYDVPRHIQDEFVLPGVNGMEGRRSVNISPAKNPEIKPAETLVPEKDKTEKTEKLDPPVPAVEGKPLPSADAKVIPGKEEVIVPAAEEPVIPAVPTMRGNAGKMWAQEPSFCGNWPTRIVGVLDSAYLLAQSDSGLVLIDQHAAHERVMFERLLDEAHRNNVVQQKLLLPEVVELPRHDINLLLGSMEIFETLGFDIESAGGTTVMVNALPENFSKCSDIAGFFADVLQEIGENNSSRLPLNLESVARAACRAAVKAHDILPETAQEKLLEDLKNCRQGTLCPHGRPTMITLSFKEIEKRFHRR